MSRVAVFLLALFFFAPAARAEGDPVLAAHSEDRPVVTVFGTAGFAGAWEDGPAADDRTSLGTAYPFTAGASVGWLPGRRFALIGQGVIGGAALSDRRVAFASLLVGARAWIGRGFAEWTLGAGTGWSSEHGGAGIELLTFAGAIGYDVARSPRRAYHLALRIDGTGAGGIDDEDRVSVFYPSLQLGVTWY